MGLPIVEIATGPVTVIFNISRGSLVLQNEQSEKNAPLLSPHVYQPKPGYLVPEGWGFCRRTMRQPYSDMQKEAVIRQTI